MRIVTGGALLLPAVPGGIAPCRDGGENEIVATPGLAAVTSKVACPEPLEVMLVTESDATPELLVDTPNGMGWNGPPVKVIVIVYSLLPSTLLEMRVSTAGSFAGPAIAIPVIPPSPVRLTLPLWPSLVAVIVTGPLPTPVITPLALTVAIAASLVE